VKCFYCAQGSCGPRSGCRGLVEATTVSTFGQPSSTCPRVTRTPSSAGCRWPWSVACWVCQRQGARGRLATAMDQNDQKAVSPLTLATTRVRQPPRSGADSQSTRKILGYLIVLCVPSAAISVVPAPAGETRPQAGFPGQSLLTAGCAAALDTSA